VLAVVFEHVEQHERGGRILAELADTACGGMDARLERLEGPGATELHQQLSVEDEAIGIEARDKIDDFGKVTSKLLSRFRRQFDLAVMLSREAAEAIPLGLEPP